MPPKLTFVLLGLGPTGLGFSRRNEWPIPPPRAERIMIESSIAGVVALGSYAWFKHHQRKLKLVSAEWHKQFDEASGANDSATKQIGAKGQVRGAVGIAEHRK